MTPFRTVIADDEEAARSRIRKLLRAEDAFEVVGEAANGTQTVAAVRSLDPDLLFLDIQMPGLDGFEVLEELLPDELPIVVFVTAYDRYALRAFEKHAADYLLKPFDDDRFRDALEHVRGRLRRPDWTEVETRVRSLLDAVASRGGETPAAASTGGGGDGPLERIPVKRRGRLVLVDVDEIDWIEAAGDYVRLHVGERSYLAGTSMSALEGRLDDRFVRVHRSAIVRTDRIARLSPRSHGDYDLTLRDGTELRSSRSYREALSRALGVEL